MSGHQPDPGGYYPQGHPGSADREGLWPMSEQLAITYYPVGDLAEYHRNPHVGDVDTIAESLREHGQFKAIVVNEGSHTGRPLEVLAGNHTLKAAAKLGWDTIAATTVDVDEQRAAKINAVDNRASAKGHDDERLLVELLSDLDDLVGTGYEQDDLEALIASLDDADPDELPPALTDPDDAPGVRAKSVTQLGDVWSLGPHRLVVGDCTDTDVWDTLLGGAKANLVWTDPPYGVGYVGKTKDALTIDNDRLNEHDLGDLLRACFALALTHCEPGAGWYVASPPGETSLTFGGILADLDVLHQTLIWVKDQFVLGRSDYHYRHEPVFYGWTPGAAHHPTPDRTRDTIFEFDRPKRSKDHPTMKPVALIAEHIENSTDTGQLVVDPFAGSGSTLIACHTTGRVAHLIELDSRYADVILRRYYEHTDIEPVRDDGTHWTDIAPGAAT